MITIASPLGPLRLRARGDELAAVHLPNDESVPDEPDRACDVLLATADQLREYFAGHRRTLLTFLALTVILGFTFLGFQAHE